MTTPEAKATLRNDLATILADSLGDILKHDNDYADAVTLLDQAMAEHDAARKIAALSHGSGVNIMESIAEADRPTEAVSQLRDISSWLEAEGEDELMVDADELADSIASAYKVGA